MARSRRNYLCITDSGEVKKYASQSLAQILEEKEDYYDPFQSIISTGLHWDSDTDFEELEWHD